MVLYKTVWEIKQRTLIDMSKDRGAYVCQSQSLNLFVDQPNFAKLTSMHFYAWESGLKTGMYYLRTKAAADAIKFTVDQMALQKELPAMAMATTTTVVAEKQQAEIACSLDNREACESCSG